MRTIKLWALIGVAGLLLLTAWSCSHDIEAPRLDKESLKGWLSDPKVMIIDVRKAEDWQASDKKIKGAVRRDPQEVKTWGPALPKDKKIVFYGA